MQQVLGQRRVLSLPRPVWVVLPACPFWGTPARGSRVRTARSQSRMDDTDCEERHGADRWCSAPSHPVITRFAKRAGSQTLGLTRHDEPVARSTYLHSRSSSRAHFRAWGPRSILRERRRVACRIKSPHPHPRGGVSCPKGTLTPCILVTALHSNNPGKTCSAILARLLFERTYPVNTLDPRMGSMEAEY